MQCNQYQNCCIIQRVLIYLIIKKYNTRINAKNNAGYSSTSVQSARKICHGTIMRNRAKKIRGNKMAVLNDPNFDIFASFPRLDFQRNELLSATTFFLVTKYHFGCLFRVVFLILLMRSIKCTAEDVQDLFRKPKSKFLKFK